MKMCLILQRRFAYVGHELAICLAKDHGIKEFCAYVQVRSSYEFLSTQKDLHYSSLLLDEDIQRSYVNEPLDIKYLKWLEDEYGIPNLWPYINVDRVIRFSQHVREYPYDTSRFTHEEMLRMLQVYAKSIIAFLDKEKPDVLFSAPVGGIGTVLLHHIAKKRGIQTLVMSFTGIRNCTTVSEAYDRLTFVEEIVERDSSTDLLEISMFKDARAYIDEFRKKPRVYSEIHEPARRKFRRSQYFDFLQPKRFVGMVRWLWTLFNEWRLHPQYRGDYSYVHPWGYILDACKRKIRNLFGLSDLYDLFDESVPYAFFPLHLEPELSLLLLARFNIDQIEVVRRVSQSLPVGMKLVVKEHPQMVPLRPRRFYKTLKKIPNVVLIRPDISSFRVITHAALVTVITGTAGWEAIVMGKPVISFGDIFYNALPSVVRSRTPEDLPAQIKDHLAKDPDAFEESIVRFVAAILEDSAHVDILDIWELGGQDNSRQKGIAALSSLVARRVREVN